MLPTLYSKAAGLKLLSDPNLCGRAITLLPRKFIATSVNDCAATPPGQLPSQEDESDQSLKPYNAIPSFPRGLPFIGNMHHLFKKPFGFSKPMENLKILRRECDPEDVGMLRCHSPIMNKTGGGRNLFVFKPEFVEKAFRNEGQYPYRGPGSEVFRTMRLMRPDLFPPGESLGLVTEDGSDWKEFRSKVQQDMMRPSSAYYYVDTQQEVAESFVQYIRRKRDSVWKAQDGVTSDNFISDLYAYGFEAIANIALSARLGAFDENPDPKIVEVLNRQQNLVDLVGQIMISPIEMNLLGKYGPKFRRMHHDFDNLAEYVKDKIHEATERTKIKIKEGSGDNVVDDMPIIEKLIRRCGMDSSIPFIMAFDMCVAGIDTTGNTLGFLLYQLAVNPEAQDKLRAEICQHDARLTVKSLNKMKYLRAAMKESHRLLPVVLMNLRETSEDMTMAGYHIPAGTYISMPHTILTHDEKQFPQPESFLPERWFRENVSSIHPFAHLPFSFGTRSCIGKRFAELEVQVLICVLLRHFEIEWTGQVGPLGTDWKFLNVPDQPLKFRFKDI